jgi:hypothetical protein
VKVELFKGGILEVVVTEAESKKPVEKVSVGVQPEASDRSLSSLSDKHGVARMRLVPGQYQLNYVYKQGYSSQRPQEAITIEDGKTTRIEYELAGQPKIIGVVRDEKDKPLKGVKIRICPMGRDDVTSDNEGKFVVSWDSRGWGGSRIPVMYLVGRYQKGNLAEAVEISEDTKTLDLKLKPGLTFTGKVVDPNDKGIANSRITIMLRAGNWASPIARDMAKTNAEGRFEVNAIPDEHNYLINASAEGYGQNSTDVNADDAVNDHIDVGELTLLVANLSVSGVVVDANDNPVANARIYCYGENQSHRNTQTNADGKFTLEKICAGRLRINASTSGRARLYGYIETEGGATDVKLVVSERPSSTRYVPKQPPSLIGKPLPELKDLKIDLTPADINDKMILVCFFDMQQRPSRNCIMQLVKQAEQLKPKGVTVVAVQASKVDENTLAEWIKKSNITFAVGMFECDSEKIRFTWGIKSLPWLILADRKHIVTAEGISLSELDKKVKEATDAER